MSSAKAGTSTTRAQRVTREAIRHEAKKLLVVSLIVSVVWVIGAQVDSGFLKALGNGAVFGILITIPMVVLHILKVQEKAEQAEALDEGH